jgi:hypothetical protein
VIRSISVGDPASYSSSASVEESEVRLVGSFPSYLSTSLIKQFLPFLLIVAIVVAIVLPSDAKKKDGSAWGEGLIVNIPLPESEVLQVVSEIAANGIIRGTKEYNKDEFVAGAKAAVTSKVFPDWTQGGEVIYKVKDDALDPRNFKDSGDLGTLAVRYVIKQQGPKNTVLRIDAAFREETRHTVHVSNGSVESAEYRDIQDHLDLMELMKKQDAEAERERQERLANKQNAAGQPAGESSSGYRPTLYNSPAADNPTQVAENSAPTTTSAPIAQPAAVAAQPAPQNAPSETMISPPQSAPPPAAAQTDLPKQSGVAPSPSEQSLKQHVEDLRRQVERVVKSPGAPLKSAPFHTAGTLQSLPTGTEVLIVVSTPYWYGVETHDGQHGWIMRDELEQKQ